MAIYDINGNNIGGGGGGGSVTVVNGGIASPNQYDCIVKNINHRGYTADGARENTLAAYKASKTKGFYYVETDVRHTSDGVAILQHNDYVTYDGVSTAVSNLTYAQMQEVYADIATFDDFIALCRNIGLHPYIELKAGTQAQVQALVDKVADSGMRGKVTWFDTNAQLSQYVHSYDQYARIGVEATGGVVDSTTIARAIAMKGDYNEVFVDAWTDKVTSSVIEMCKSAGFPLEVWTFVNNTSEIVNFDPYISGWTTNQLMAGKVLYDANIE